MCAVFELGPQGEERHVELPLRALTVLMDELARVERYQCKCGFRAPELGPHPDCPLHWRSPDPGAIVVREDPSAFEGAAPIRTFSDGSQSYGPYQVGQGNGAGWND